MDVVIVIVILLISTFFNWIKKKGEESSNEWSEVEGPAPGRQTPPPLPKEGRKGFDWEEELRRMLELEEPQRPPPSRPPPAVPPPLVRQESRPIPRPPQYKVVTPPAPPPRTPKPVKQATLAGIQRRTEPVMPLVSVEPSNIVFERPRLMAVRESRRRSPEIERALALLRTPHSARQGIILSTILAPPKALES